MSELMYLYDYYCKMSDEMIEKNGHSLDPELYYKWKQYQYLARNVASLIEGMA